MSRIPNEHLIKQYQHPGVIQKPVPYLQYITTPLTVKSDASRQSRTGVKQTSPNKKTPPDSVSTRSFSIATSGNRAGTANISPDILSLFSC